MLTDDEERLIADHIARFGVTRIPEGHMATQYDKPPTPKERVSIWINARNKARRLRKAERRATA